MRLIDQVFELGQSRSVPWWEDIVEFGELLRSAAHFEITPQVVEAAVAIASSDIDHLLAARKFIRSPHQRIWAEWNGFPSDHVPRQIETSKIQKSGVLIECEDGEHAGIMHTFAKMNTHVFISPVAYVFDYRDEFPIFSSMKDRYQEFANGGAFKQVMENKYGCFIKRTGQSTINAVNEKERRTAMTWSMRCARYIDRAYDRMGEEKFGGPHAGVCAAMTATIAQFAESLLICTNSRNLVSVGEPEDLSRLNTSRIKQKRLALTPLRPIRLNLTNVAKRKMEASCQPVDMNAHWVMGHYKIRKSGVFWWSPFKRGSIGEAPISPRPHIVKADGRRTA